MTVSLLAVIGGLAIAPARAQRDRNQLWNLVNLKCLRHLAKSEDPVPCDSVDVSHGWERGTAYLKAPVGRARMLAIPNQIVTGVEDPALLSPEEPNYFATALAARSALLWRLSGQQSRATIAVAIDSKRARDQDQLSLIVDCLDKDVAVWLTANGSSLDASWRRLDAPLKGRMYWTRWVEASALADTSPFRLLADGVEGAKLDMASWSLAAVPFERDGRPGAVLLADRADDAGGGRASDLEDLSCAVTSR